MRDRLPIRSIGVGDFVLVDSSDVLDQLFILLVVHTASSMDY